MPLPFSLDSTLVQPIEDPEILAALRRKRRGLQVVRQPPCVHMRLIAAPLNLLYISFRMTRSG